MFLEGQLTLLREGKRLADEIIRQVSQQEGEGGGKVDALFTSMGFLTFNGQREGSCKLSSFSSIRLPVTNQRYDDEGCFWKRAAVRRKRGNGSVTGGTAKELCTC